MFFYLSFQSKSFRFMTVWEWIKGRLGASERRQRLRWRDKVGGKRKQEAAWRSGSPLPAHPGCLSSHPVSPFSPKAAKSSQCISQPHIHFISSSLSLSLPLSLSLSLSPPPATPPTIPSGRIPLLCCCEDTQASPWRGPLGK